jgi:hypothetical protein
LAADAEESARFVRRSLFLSEASQGGSRSRDPRNRFLAKVKDFPSCEAQLKPAGFKPSDARLPILNEAGNLRHDDGFRHGRIAGPGCFFSRIYGKDERHASTKYCRTASGTLRILPSNLRKPVEFDFESKGRSVGLIAQADLRAEHK